MKSETKKPDGAVLSTGLRRVLIGAILAGFALATVQAVAISKLQREIAHWAWTSDVNVIREGLMSRSLEKLASGDTAETSAVLALFDALQRAADIDDGSVEHLRHAESFAKMGSEARTYFVRAQKARAALNARREAIREDVAVLQGMAGDWAAQIWDEERRIQAYSEEVDARYQEVNALESGLTSVLLSAQLLQQQAIAVARLAQTASEEITRSSVASLSASDLPTVCAEDEQETGGRICSPSVARVLSAIDQLQNGDAAAIPRNVNLTLQGLEAYIRAGQGRLDSLSAENAAFLVEMRTFRQRLSEINLLNASLNRTNRVLLDIGTTLDLPISTFADLEAAKDRNRFYTSQIDLRMSGLLRSFRLLDGDPEQIATINAAIAQNWNTSHDLTAERIEASNAFGSVMESLSSSIASHAATVRREATLWVSLYASSFLILAGVLVAMSVGLVLLARRRFIAPLVRVTGTIIGLARGEIEEPVALAERAFGFDRLGEALEQLRQEMVERHLLAERNEAQQAIIASNVEKLESANKEMAWMAMHDPLTGLANRRRADLDLDSLNGNYAQSQAGFCVMQVDIDRFKAINDSLGHAAGDFVLKTVSEILKSCVGGDANCYRVGGDEFLIILFGHYSAEKAGSLAERLIKRIESPMDFSDHRCDVGASIGIALGQDTGFDAKQCVINADLALYSVKRKGRGSFRVFNDELAALSGRTQRLSDKLIMALERKPFQPYYQPQFDAKTRRLRGVEVLCRWHDDELGWISPGEFLPVAEDLEAVGRIDEILFEKVAEDLDTLFDLGLSLPRVSFNLTADRLLKSGLAKELCRNIGRHTKIAVELLESMSLDDPPDSVRWAIDDLREHGIDIEIDDFGSHRASLAGLMAINPQTMKIDRSIVVPIVESPRHLDLVKKIIDIGTALNIEVVAEGVETEEHAERLSALGCGVLQGFGLAKPMPFDDLVAFCGHSVGASNAVA